MFLVLRNCLKVVNSIYETSSRVAHLLYFIHTLHGLHSPIARLKIVHRIRHRDSIVLLSHLVLGNQVLVLHLEEVLPDDAQVLLRKAIFVNQMLQRKISNHHDVVQNISSAFSSLQSLKISIHSDVRRV